MKQRTTTMWSQPQAVFAFSRLLARRAVLERMRELGRKPREFTGAEIIRLVGDYLRDHGEETQAQARAICAELHQRELRKREMLRQRRLAAKQWSVSKQIPNTRPVAASTSSKEFAHD